jgi:septum site-determining protein MinC
MKPRRQAVIKGSSLPVLRIVVRDGDAGSLQADLIETIESARPMLAEGIAVLDLRERQSGDVNLTEIVDMVRDASIRLAAVLINEPGEREALADLDLPVIEVPLPARDRPSPVAIEGQVTANASDPAPVAEPAEQQSIEQRPGEHQPLEQQSIEQRPGEPPSMEQPAAQARLQPPSGESTPPGIAPLYLTRPLRSGQRFYAQGRDAVVAARTSRGSELLADGSIYAFSPLRGRVLAGASGDTNACIVATHLDAELVAVAGVYRTFEPDELKAHGSGPVSVTWSLDADGNEQLTLAALADSSSIQRT